jgi:CSLREA domain-containing protein
MLLRLLLIRFLLLLFAFGFSANANAATFTVTSNTDVGTGGCTAVGSGDGCSLREAITAANAATDADVINFASAAFATAQAIVLSGSQLEIAPYSAVRIMAPTSGVTVNGNNQSRVFEVGIGAALTLEGLTLTGGANASPSGSSSYRLGGGIYNGGTLTISNCTLSGNLAGEYAGYDSGYGGGIYNGGTLTVRDSTFSNNKAPFFRSSQTNIRGFGDGGGIYNTGSAAVINCTFSDNYADTWGGGIYNTVQGILTVNNCVLSNNHVGADRVSSAGGALYNEGTLVIENSILSNNSAGTGGNGGGIHNQGSVAARDCTFSNNSAPVGGAVYNSNVLALLNCTFAGNVAAGYNLSAGGLRPRVAFIRGQGGALYNASGQVSVTLTNNTFHNNVVTGSRNNGYEYQGGDRRTGGAIYNASGSLSLLNCTLNGNADNSTNTDETARIGTLVNAGTLTSHNTVFVDGSSTPFSGFTDPTASGDADKNFAFASMQSAGLKTLQDNGGPVETMSLEADSPLRDAGLSQEAPSFDARGALRPQGNGVDVGAFEEGAIFSQFYSLAGTVKRRDTAEGVAGVTITITNASGKMIGKVISDENGEWKLSALSPGTYTATPNRTGYYLQPASRTGRITKADLTLPAFTTLPPTETLVVTTLTDENDGTSDPSFGTGTSLREAVNYAAAKAGADTITFAPGLSGTITLTGSGFVLQQNLTIIGPGAKLLTVSGNGQERVFNITGGTHSLSGLTISGGGIGNDVHSFNGSSTLTVSYCAFVGNSSSIGGGLSNGSGGTLNVSHCTFSNNAPTLLNGDQGGGAIYAYIGAVTISNCTFSGNSAAYGGAINNNLGRMTISDCTFSNNSATQGGSIYNQGWLTISNTILDDTQGSSIVQNGNGFSDGGHNLARDNGGGMLTASTSRLNTDPKLGQLADNGGPTFTHALLTGSPAIDVGNSTLTTDQRGISRPQGSSDDIGAFEVFTGNAPTLGLAIAPMSVAESAGTNAAIGTVTRSGNTIDALTVTLSSSNTGAATVPANITIPAYQTTATFAISAVDNAIADGAKTATITASVTDFVSVTANVTVTDNDVVGITVEPVSGLVTSEARAQNTFTVVLTSQPTADVTIPLSSSNAAEGTPNPTSLVFTPQNWNQLQTVTITGVDDSIVDGNQTYSIVTAPAQSGDANYNDRDAADVVVMNLDNDTAGLSIRVSADYVTEGSGLTVTVTRNTPVSESMVVMLSSNHSGVLLPPKVTISVGSTTADLSLSIPEDQTVTGNSQVILTASAGALSSSATFTVEDNDTAGLVLSLSANSVEEGGSVTGTLRRNTREKMLVNLSASGAQVPATITIPANVPSVTFNITTIDDAVAQGTRDAVITATQGTLSSSQRLSIVDNEQPTLTLSVTPNSFSEAALPIRQAVATGTVSRNTPIGAAVTVNLNSSDRSEATVPTTVTIPAGSTSASFVIMPVDDKVADGSQIVQIGAAAAGFVGAQSTLTVKDDEKPTLTLTVTPTRFAEGATGVKATITRNSKITADTPTLAVNLSSSDTSEVRVPVRVTIPAHTASVTVTLTVPSDTVSDGPQRVTLKARATGFAEGTSAVTVLDKAAASNLMISGQLLSNSTPAFNKAPIPEATLVLRKGTVVVDEVTTDRLGNYSFKQLAVGNYTVTPLKPDFTFAPTSSNLTLPRPSTIKGAPHAVGVNFVGTPRTSIRGTLMRRLDNSVLMPVVGGSLIAYHRDGAIYARTDKNGHYLFDRVGYTAYQIMPLMPGSYFRPRVRIASANATTPNVTGIDFLAEGSDSTAPQVTIVEPRASSFTLDSRSTLNVKGTASDSGGGNVAAVTVALAKFSGTTDTTPDGFWYWKNNTFISLDSPVVVEAVAKGTTSWSLLEPTMVSDLRSLPAGFYGIRVTVSDGAGNVTRSTWRKFQITGSTTRSDTSSDNGDNTAPSSSVRLSSAQASMNSIVLHFTSALDSSDATDASNFVVQVNGEAVEVESVAYSNGIVRLGLPEGVVQAGDVVQVTWQNLHDSAGHVLATPDLNLNVR